VAQCKDKGQNTLNYKQMIFPQHDLFTVNAIFTPKRSEMPSRPQIAHALHWPPPFLNLNESTSQKKGYKQCRKMVVMVIGRLPIRGRAQRVAVHYTLPRPLPAPTHSEHTHTESARTLQTTAQLRGVMSWRNTLRFPAETCTERDRER